MLLQLLSKGYLPRKRMEKQKLRITIFYIEQELTTFIRNTKIKLGKSLPVYF
jgi:hypothetical protein